MPLPNLDEFRGKLRSLQEGDYWWRYLLSPSPGYSLLVGEPGVGKTNLLLQLGASIAAGVDCLGIPTKQGRVGCVLFEGGENLKDRIDKLEQTFGRDNILNRLDIDRWEPMNLKALESKLIEAFKGYDVAIIDPFTKLSLGSINNTHDMIVMVSILDNISKKSGAHLIVNHHLRKKNNDPRSALRVRDLDDTLGSVQLVAGSLTALLLAHETQDDLREMGLAHFRGAPKLNKDCRFLHFARAQASPEDIPPIRLFQDREKLIFQDAKGMVFI